MANDSSKIAIVLILFLILGLIFAYMVWQRAFKFTCPPEMICTATTATNYYNENASGKRPVGVCGTDQAPFCKFQDIDDDTDDDTSPASGQGTNNQATLTDQGSDSANVSGQSSGTASTSGQGTNNQGSDSANVSGQPSGTASTSGDGQSNTSTT